MLWGVNVHVNMCNNKYKILIKSITIKPCKCIWSITDHELYEFAYMSSTRENSEGDKCFNILFKIYKAVKVQQTP